MPRLILDLMGGDHSPHAMLEGALQALPELSESELVLVGDQKAAFEILKRRHFRVLHEAIETGSAPSGCKVSLIHADQTIEMEDSIRAVRTKPRASLNLGCAMAARAYTEKATPTAVISAGHSGAMMASALVHMGRLANVERPAIAVKLPTLSPDGCVVLDVGANVDCKPEHLRDFAIMGALYGQVERKSPGLPRVGLLSNGEEKSKGNELTRAALAMIDGLNCFKNTPKGVGTFLGYAEGKEIFRGQVDVVVTDGFVGNVVLKSVEGLGSAVMALFKRELKSSFFAPVGILFMASVFRRLKRKLDYAEYGAAPLLGVAGYAFICHGRSNGRAMKNALLRAQTALNERLVERLEDALASALDAKAV